MLFDWGELRDIRIFTEPFFFWLNGILKQHHWSFWSLNKRFYSHTLSFIVRPGRNLDLLFVQRLFLNFIIFHHLERLEIFKTKALGFLLHRPSISFSLSLTAIYIFSFGGRVRINWDSRYKLISDSKKCFLSVLLCY